jgi:hypothetical protein
MNIASILSRIPENETFYTVDEMAAQGLRLQARYPGVITRFSAGQSRQGDSLWCLKLGSGVKNALCFACPHPNEPIGAMTLFALAEILAGDPELLEETGMTWHLIPCVDPDGTRLNEGWFKGPFDIERYIRGFYRPVGSRQVEWTFPFRHQAMWFDRPLPETRALMALIDELRPRLVYSLHNSAFGGAYWYVNRSDPALCVALEGAALRQGVPLHLGEPESPYITKYSKAVHSMMSLRQYYEYRARHGHALPEGELSCGTCSADYVATVCDSLTLMAELPYFLVKGIDDETPSGIRRGDALREKARRRAEHGAFLRERWLEARSLFQEDNPFPLLVDDAIRAYEGDVEAAADDGEFDRIATRAEAMDSLWLTQIFEALDLTLAVRACDFELSRVDRKAERAALHGARERMDERLTELCREIEGACEYEVASIPRLVSVQLESVLQSIPHCP